MTLLCGGGASGTKPGTPAFVILGDVSLPGLLGPAYQILQAFVPIIGQVAVNTSQLCSTDPPNLTAVTGLQLFALLNLDSGLGEATAASAIITDWILNQAWYQYCQCTGMATPAAPPLPALPADIPVVNPSFTGTSGYLSAVLADSPTHYWRCADPPGSQVLRDLTGGMDLASGASNNPSPTPNAGYTGPNSDGGSLFGGSYYGAQVTANIPAYPYTIELWLYPVRLQSEIYAFTWGTSNLGGVVTIGSTVNQWEINDHSNLAVDLGAVVGNQWHHVVLVLGAVTNDLYVDNAHIGSPARGAVGSTPGWITLGSTPNGGLQWGGGIAEVAIYGTALSAARIAAHFNAADQPGNKPVRKSPSTITAFGTDVGALSRIEQLASLLQQYTLPFSYSLGTVHAGLTGTNTTPISNLMGVRVAVTATPPGTQVLSGNPVYEKNLGWISVSDGGGMLQEKRVTQLNFEWFPTKCELATSLNWFFTPGTTVTLTELSPLT